MLCREQHSKYKVTAIVYFTVSINSNVLFNCMLPAINLIMLRDMQVVFIVQWAHLFSQRVNVHVSHVCTCTR